MIWFGPSTDYLRIKLVHELLHTCGVQVQSWSKSADWGACGAAWNQTCGPGLGTSGPGLGFAEGIASRFMLYGRPEKHAGFRRLAQGQQKILAVCFMTA